MAHLLSLQYAPFVSDIELAFYSALASLKINHDKLDSSARKVLGLYEISHRDDPERSTRMQIHGNALTSDDTPNGLYRAEGFIRNFNTIEDFRQVDKLQHIERAGRMIWDSIRDGTIYSCPSLLCSFSAVCFADLKKYRFTYHVAYPALHSDPLWKIASPRNDDVDAAFRRLESKETTTLVDAVQTWRYSVDPRQHGFFLVKRLRKHVLEQEWKRGRGEVEEEEDDGNLNMKAQKRKNSRSSSLSELGFLWWVGSLSSYENGFFDNAQPEDRFVCFADPSTFATNPGWMLRNLLVLVRQRWKLDKVQVLCYRDTHARREHPTSLIINLQSAEPVFDFSAEEKLQALASMSGSTALTPGQVDRFGELIPEKPQEETETETSAAKPLPIRQPPPKALEFCKVTGWERGDHGRITSRTVDLASYLDPSRLADQAVDLNLKLIKWRISPSIDLDTIKHTSCLLLGAGTLGSYVARNLMGWGVRKISFVDNGRVSYSNPVRQPLYNFKDCANGGLWKATRASDALTEIYPGVETQGIVMGVPMAGHPITEEPRTKRAYELLKKLIDGHDAIFLLMDTRESRWLPTLMAKAAGKIVINAALGFDTYMVMRHGLRSTPSASLLQGNTAKEGAVLIQPNDEVDPLRAAATDPIQPTSRSNDLSDSDELGCYFCSDVVAPADSQKAATLDQQCTVTRPGAAPIASALAVELLVSITQHRLKGHAPAPPPLTSTAIASAPSTDPKVEGSHPLGTVPHQLRGYMSTWQTLQIQGKAYNCCSACGEPIVAAYEKDGWEFVKRALSEQGYVEEVSGLAEVQRKADEALKAMEGDEEGDFPDEDDDGELL